jgi:hypothetical protein
MAGIGALIKDIKSLDEWDAMLKASAGSNLVVVLDVYIDWAGPCNVMQFFFDRLVKINNAGYFHFFHAHLGRFLFTTPRLLPTLTLSCAQIASFSPCLGYGRSGH